MAKMTPEERRKAALAAKEKSLINEQLSKTVGTTIEAVRQNEPKNEIPAQKVSINGRGRPTTAKEETKNVTLRLTPEESHKIDEWVFLGKAKNRSDAVRQAINLLFKEA